MVFTDINNPMRNCNKNAGLKTAPVCAFLFKQQQ